MSRLIDADKMIKQLDDDIKITEKYVERSIKKNDNDGYIRYSNQLNTLQSYRLIIKDMPTAFDVDKVVEQLEKEIKENPYQSEYLAGLYKAIEIVKAGEV